MTQDEIIKAIVLAGARKPQRVLLILNLPDVVTESILEAALARARKTDPWEFNQDVTCCPGVSNGD